MKYKSLSYYAIVDRKKSPGVAKKIDHSTLAANNIGMHAESKIYPPTVIGVVKLIPSLLRESSDVIMVRFSDLVFPLLSIILITLRLRGKKIVIDIPTPRSTAIKELDSAIKSKAKRTIRKIWSYISGPWVLHPANKIIHYADESPWFSLGLEQKTIKIGNGIVIDKTIPVVQNQWPDDTLNLIAVAQLANWHGYDRLINAMHLIKKETPEYKIRLTIVGSGESLPLLQSLAFKHELQDHITFTGMLSGTELNQSFNGAHIGVASLGLHRIGLQEASVLKAREYMARGLPIIGAGKDPDFEENSPFRFVVSNDDSVEELAELIYSFRIRELPRPDIVRKHAEDRLSLEGKLAFILSDL